MNSNMPSEAGTSASGYILYNTLRSYIRVKYVVIMMFRVLSKPPLKESLEVLFFFRGFGLLCTTFLFFKFKVALFGDI